MSLKIHLFKKVYFPEKYTDLHSQTLLTLLIAGVNESMNEASYPARLAGMEYSVSMDEEAIYIDVSGYSDSAYDLLNTILENMRNISISDEQFVDLRNKLIRDWKNVAMGNAYQIAREHMRKMVRKHYYISDEFASAAENISLSDIRNYSDKILKKGYIQGLVYGNVTDKQAQENTSLLKNELNI